MAEVEIPDPKEVHEKAENPFTKLIALFVAVYAVGLAFATFGASNVTKELILLKQKQAIVESKARQEEFNKWSQYQSKSTREALYRNEKEKLEIEKKFLMQGSGGAGGIPSFGFKEDQLTFFTKEEKRMESDKDQLAKEAKEIRAKGEEDVKKLEEEYHTNERKDPYFDFAEVMFQLGIVLASVAMLSNKKWPFFLSMALACVATFLMLNGFFLFAKIGFIEH